MDINSRNLGQQEEDLDKKKFRKRASMSRPNTHALSLTPWETYSTSMMLTAGHNLDTEVGKTIDNSLLHIKCHPQLYKTSICSFLRQSSQSLIKLSEQ